MQAIQDPGTGLCIYDDFLENNTTKTTDLWQVIKGHRRQPDAVQHSVRRLDQYPDRG